MKLPSPTRRVRIYCRPRLSDRDFNLVQNLSWSLYRNTTSWYRDGAAMVEICLETRERDLRSAGCSTCHVFCQSVDGITSKELWKRTGARRPALCKHSLMGSFNESALN